MRNIEQQLQACRLAIANYERVVSAFESGAATPDVGELLGNRMLLARKRRQLRALETQRTVTQPLQVFCGHRRIVGGQK